MTPFSRRAGLLFVVLLVVDTIAVTVLAVVRPQAWGIAPVIFPVGLGFVGLVVFGWAPKLTPSAERQAGMPLATRLVFRMSLAVIVLSQVAAVAIAVACLGGIVYLIVHG